MKWQEVEEAVTQVWSRQGSKTVRKYRCTSGPRKGRTVSKPSTCNAPKNYKASVSLKKTKARMPSSIKVKTSRTKSYNPTSIRSRKLNVPRRRKVQRRPSLKRKKI